MAVVEAVTALMAADRAWVAPEAEVTGVLVTRLVKVESMVQGVAVEQVGTRGAPTMRAMPEAAA